MPRQGRGTGRRRAVRAGRGPLRVVVTDLPYPEVLGRARAALAGYPLEREAGGELVTGWREAAEGERVADRVALRFEPFGPGATRITVTVRARAWRAGRWAPLRDALDRARAVAARLAVPGAGLGSRRLGRPTPEAEGRR